MTDKRTDNQVKQRVLIFLSSFVLFGFTYYGHNITLDRLEVLEHGTTIKAEVTRTTSKRSNKTFYVTVDNKELDGGENFGNHQDLNVGDIVDVKYLPNKKYVVADGVNRYRNMIVFQYLMFATSLMLFLLPLIYPTLHKWKPTIFKWD
jgi:hypothetical protein